MNRPTSHRWRAVTLIVTVCSVVLLTACETLDERQSRALNLVGSLTFTASGALQDTGEQTKGVLTAGQNVWKNLMGGVESMQMRVSAIKKGFNMLQEGKALIEQGFGVTGSGAVQ